MYEFVQSACDGVFSHSMSRRGLTKAGEGANIRIAKEGVLTLI